MKPAKVKPPTKKPRARSYFVGNMMTKKTRSYFLNFTERERQIMKPAIVKPAKETRSYFLNLTGFHKMVCEVGAAEDLYSFHGTLLDALTNRSKKVFITFYLDRVLDYDFKDVSQHMFDAHYSEYCEFALRTNTYLTFFHDNHSRNIFMEINRYWHKTDMNFRKEKEGSPPAGFGGVYGEIGALMLQFQLQCPDNLICFIILPAQTSTAYRLPFPYPTWLLKGGTQPWTYFKGSTIFHPYDKKTGGGK